MWYFSALARLLGFSLDAGIVRVPFFFFSFSDIARLVCFFFTSSLYFFLYFFYIWFVSFLHLVYIIL